MRKSPALINQSQVIIANETVACWLLARAVKKKQRGVEQFPSWSSRSHLSYWICRACSLDRTLGSLGQAAHTSPLSSSYTHTYSCLVIINEIKPLHTLHWCTQSHTKLQHIYKSSKWVRFKSKGFSHI